MQAVYDDCASGNNRLLLFIEAVEFEYWVGNVCSKHIIRTQHDKKYSTFTVEVHLLPQAAVVVCHY